MTTSAAVTERAEAAGVARLILHDAEALKGYTTYGKDGQRYEAACALRPAQDDRGRVVGRRYYLIDNGDVDPETGGRSSPAPPRTGPELVIRVSDLRFEARRLVGSTSRGWLDARIRLLGWQRFELDGHAEPGREGRQGPHARCNVYRGRLPEVSDDDDGP